MQKLPNDVIHGRREKKAERTRNVIEGGNKDKDIMLDCGRDKVSRYMH